MTYPEIEEWTKEETAEFILNNSLSEPEYRRNLLDVIELGVDPVSLNPDHLFRDEPWQCAEKHQDILRARRVS